MTLYFGGSFNPIHHAHLICARAAAEQLGYERVVLLPSAAPPHKPAGVGDLASAEHRLAMCRRAVEPARGSESTALHSSVRLDVNDIELKRPGPSYTIDTARLLRDQTGQPVHWLIGADMLMYLPKWHMAETLIREVQMVIVARPGWELDFHQLPQAYRFLEERIVTAPLVQISASAIRDRVSRGLPIDYLTPPAVVDYIREHGLYR